LIKTTSNKYVAYTELDINQVIVLVVNVRKKYIDIFKDKQLI